MGKPIKRVTHGGIEYTFAEPIEVHAGKDSNKMECAAKVLGKTISSKTNIRSAVARHIRDKHYELNVMLESTTDEELIKEREEFNKLIVNRKQLPVKSKNMEALKELMEN